MAIDARQQGILSLNTKMFMKRTSDGDFVELKNLQETPDIGAEPETVETTTLANASRIYIAGLKDYGSLAFTFLLDTNQDDSSFKKIRAVEEAKEVCDWKVEFPDGTNFTFSGTATTVVSGAAINEAFTFTANIQLSSDITVAY